MQIHHLTKPASRRRPKLIGRGGKRGTTAGRGTKGQKARAGHSIRPEFRDTIKSLPKKRGYKTAAYRRLSKPLVVNLAVLEKSWPEKELITPRSLAAKRFVNRSKGKTGQVKILGAGQLTKKLKVSGCLLSETASDKIKAAGGLIEA